MSCHHCRRSVCIYPKCQEDCGKERPSGKGATVLRGMLTVYSVTAHGDYGAGYAVVAASCPEHAILVANTGLDPGAWNIEWLFGKAALIDGLQCNGTERIIDHFEYGE